eukprot:SAG11_NODE_2487_length_3302_cov_29.812051_4_plen_153_part_00
MSHLMDRLKNENIQMRDRLITAEGDKKQLLSSRGSAGSGVAAAAQDEKWRKNVRFDKTFNGKSTESIETHLRDLKFALRKAKVTSNEQKESILLQSLGDSVCTSDFVREQLNLALPTGTKNCLPVLNLVGSEWPFYKSYVPIWPDSIQALTG